MGDKARDETLEGLAPKIAEGLTELPIEEVDDALPSVPAVDGTDLAKQLADDSGPVNRVPRPRFVAEDDLGSVWKDEPTGRLQRNVVATFAPETFRAMQEGMICLRCYEPQETAFPEACDLCGYSMKERQIMDIAMEFQGEKHVGPGKPIGDYLAEQEERAERAAFEERKRNGGRGIRVKQKVYSPGAAKEMTKGEIVLPPGVRDA